MSNYAKGARREREYQARLEAQGWYVVRSAGSKGEADLIALRPDRRPRMLEIKATEAGPFAGFPPVDRDALQRSAERAGADCELIWWPSDRKGPRSYPPDTWPRRVT